MHEIKITGEIIPFEDQWIIDQGGYVNLSTVQKNLDEAGGKDVKVVIRSPGGCVQTGFDIYNVLRRYAKENNAKIETLGEGIVSSIATVIFLAGDKRTLTENTYPFLHNAWTYSCEGMDSKKFQRIADDLAICDNRISEHYALHTDLTKEEALELMNNDTSISPEVAKQIRFATDIEEVFRPLALKRFSKTNKINKMNKKTQSILAKAAKALGLISNKVVATADGTELDFYELADDAVIAVGDKAYFDGADAEGDFLMPDGETYVFVGGELTEILPVISDDSETDLAEANATIALLTDQLEKATNKINEQEVLISNYKASSKPVNTASKPAPRNAPVAKKENTIDSLDEKIKQASNLKLKK